MSYSRWSNSTWYTYWISMGPADNEAPKEEQRMAIHYSIEDSITYQYSYDIDEFMELVEEEVAKMSAEGFNVEVANAESFQLEDEFDIIVAGELIEHLSNPGKFLSNCYDHLSEDGIVIITTPNPRRLQHLYWYLSGNESRINTEHTMWFDNQVFDELVSRHNFRIRQFHYYSPSVSLVSRPLFNLGLFQPLTSGGFTFVLEPK